MQRDTRAVAWESLSWTNPPTSSLAVDGRLDVVTADSKDFWRTTAYGFVHDDGHFLHVEMSGDFGIEVSLSGDFSGLYDHAGLMVRRDATTWLKAGVEFCDGALRASVVNTREVSDWSVGQPLEGAGPIRVRLSRSDDAVNVRIGRVGMPLELVRVAPFVRDATISVGPMCCSPKRSGLKVTFSDLVIAEPDPALA